MDVYILGISAFYHDSAACLVKNGEIIAAAQEERFTRKKQDQSFPINAINYCMQEGEIGNISDIHRIVYYELPQLRFQRIVSTFLKFAPKGFKVFKRVIPLWVRSKFWVNQTIREQLGYDGLIEYLEHHLAHASSAYYPSPFKSAAFLIMDGVGEWATASIGRAKGNKIEILREMHFPDSLGLLYSAFTYHLGFRVNSGEYKVMGLAPYGEPKYVDKILSNLIDIREDGSFKMNMKYFNYEVGMEMTSHHFTKLFNIPPRNPEVQLSQEYMDMARSIQEVTNQIVLKMARSIQKETGEKNLCMAGGVALNCVANGLVVGDKIFENVWIQPAGGDAGGALGAALYSWYYNYEEKDRTDTKGDKMKSSLLGPSYTDKFIGKYLDDYNLTYTKLRLDEITEKVAKLIADGSVIGWFQGRMEFGPRALGARSILGDPRSETMQKTMNIKIKFRESFRPFAPSILKENASDYFELDQESPYMTLVAPVSQKYRKHNVHENDIKGLNKLNIIRSGIPAVTHVDYSARVQTVTEDSNPIYYKLIHAFYEITKCPILINTSFNVRGEPIVATPEDAYRCFMRTKMDYLVLGPYLLDKKDQVNPEEGNEWLVEFELD